MDNLETPAKARPGVARRVVLIGLGLVALNLSLVAGCFLSKWLPAGKVIERERAQVKEGIAALRAERVIRPVYFEPEEAGNSWELLAAGLPRFGELSEEELKAFPAFRMDDGEPPPSAEEIAEVIAKVEPHIEALRRALRRRWVEPNYRYEESFNMRLPLVSNGVQACRILGDRAMALAGEGRSEQAVEMFIIGWGVSDHLAVKGVLVNELVRIAGGNVMADRLRQILAKHTLSAKSLEQLESTLVRIEAARPDILETYKRECLYIGAGIINLADSGDTREFEYDLRGTAWRQWFSMRIVAAEFFETQAAVMAKVESATRRPLKDRLRQMDELMHDVQMERRNVLVALLAPSLLRCWKTHAEDARTVSLARLSVAVARHREDRGAYPAALSDLVPTYLPAIPKEEMAGVPFGYFVKDDAATIYAWGEDGDDDGGVPVDESDENHRTPEEGDIVWIVRRAK